MKGPHAWLFGCLAAASLFFPIAGHGADFDFNFQSIYAGPHVLNIQVLQPWAKGVLEKTDGKVDVHFFVSDSLVKSEDVVPALLSGTLDIGASRVSGQGEILPYSQALELYHMARDCEQSSEMYWQMYKQLPELRAELDKPGKVLSLWGSDRSGAFSAKGPILSPADLQGKRVLIWSPAHVDMIRSWGGVPVQVGVADTYSALKRGLGDVFFGPLPAGVSAKLIEVAKDVTVIPAHSSICVLWINHEAWNSLPPVMQKLVEEGTGRVMNLRCGELLKAATDRDLETMAAFGCKVHLLSDAQLGEFATADAEVIRVYQLKEMKRLGVPNSEDWLKRVHNVAASVE